MVNESRSTLEVMEVSWSRAATASSKNPYIDTEAEDHSDENTDETELANEEEGDSDLSAWSGNNMSLQEGSDGDEYDSLRDAEEEGDSGPSTWLLNVTCLPGPAAKHTLAAAINNITDKQLLSPPRPFKAGCICYLSIVGPYLRSQSRVTHCISGTSTQYIAAHLRRKGFPITVLLWGQGQLYVVSDSPRTISLSLPTSLHPLVKEYLYISDAEHEAVKHVRLTFPSPAWVKIKTSMCNKYNGAIGCIFEESEENNNFVKVLIPPWDFPYPMPQGSVALFDLARLPIGKFTTDIIRDGKVVGWTYKGEQYYMGLLLKKFHRYLLELAIIPHPDNIRLHLQSRWDTRFIKNTELMFSMQFLCEGDAARVLAGEVHSEIGKVISIDHIFDSVWLKINTDGLQREIDLQVQDVERVFWVSDAVRVVVVSYLGLEGHIIGMSDEMFDVCQQDTKEEIQVLKYYLDHRPLRHMLQAQLALPLLQVVEPPPEHDPIEVGDYFPAGSTTLFLWDAGLDVNADDMEGPQPTQVPTAMVRRTHLAPTIKYTKDRAYDVKPGDFVSVVHGPKYRTMGFMHSVDFPTAHMRIQSSSDYALIEVPIRFTMMLHKKSLDEFKGVIGSEVFIIGGDLKGYRATLYSVMSNTCTVAVHGQRLVTLKHHDVATSYALRLNGAIIEGNNLISFCKMRKKFSTLNTDQGSSSSPPSNVLSPWSTSVKDNNMVLNHPSGVNTSESIFDPWTTNNLDDIHDRIEAEAEKLTGTGPLPWLMNKEFSSMLSEYHVLLKVSPNVMGGRLINRFMSTACPDPFCGPNGPTPEGSVAAYCTSNSAGAALKHYHIPAKDLTPAPPHRKNQLCLVLNRQYRGLVFPVAKCNVKSWTVELTLMGGTALMFTLCFEEVCLVELEQNR
ncbi:uncharacterized protein F5891DRAFT_1195724 [Suillus fuscotomentosus]|uniref:Uncharacterized protein n=1 Tax=Suillus fuscotomentosus TaxID=1912939 RepID=A0AAD4DWR8_9AGAM|nr:uncharacterized protein F5891DRAFT_1195724 [Suillus fuscotomentosus]KAG1894033.1 hypothetical protein F5891DRAFT_1195724 [Suillus fuscotomentosus]